MPRPGPCRRSRPESSCSFDDNVDELLAYQDAAEQQKLSARARPMIRVGNELTADEAIALIDGLGARSGFGDD